MSTTDPVSQWNRCLEIIRDNVPEQTYKTWFDPIVPLKYEEGTLVVQVPSQFFYEFLEDKFVDLIRKTLYRVFGEGTELMYNVMVDRSSQPSQTVNLASTARTVVGPRRQVISAKVPQQPTSLPELDPHLNPECNFETFIEGVSNKLARSVAQAVAQNPAKTAFNPLFIHGSSGVGKTHLANAIGNRIRELFPQMRVLYVSAHLFQVQYTDSVRQNTTNDFINFYQTIDTLIIDDIQELAGATKTQNTFFHIFNQLHQNGRQLVLTSDRPPVQLQGMEDRLITRFKWGMVAELERPTVDLRRGILRSRMHRDGLDFPPDVIDYIAEHVTDSVRDLEGTLISIMAHATVYGREVDLDLTRSIVEKAAPRRQAVAVTVEDIIALVCRHYGLEEEIIRTKSRRREVVHARQVAMYLAKEHTDLSSSKIGVLIGGRDHATVLHALHSVRNQQQIDKLFRAELADLQEQLLGR